MNNYLKNVKNALLMGVVLAGTMLAVAPATTQAASRVQNCRTFGSADAIEQCFEQLNIDAWNACIGEPPEERGQCVEDYREADTGSTGGVATNSDELDNWLQRIINLLSGAVGITVVFSLVMAGIQYTSAGGNASQVAAAKNRIAMAILAMVLFLFSYAILQWLIPGGIF